MLILSLNELKLIPKSRAIRGYKSMSEESFLNAPNELDLEKSEKNLDNAKIKKVLRRF